MPAHNFTRRRTTFILTIVAASLLLVSLMSAYIYFNQRQQLIDTRLLQMKTEAELIANYLSDYLLRNDYTEARNFLRKWHDTRTDIVSLNVILDNRKHLFSYEATENQSDKLEITTDSTYGVDRRLQVELAYSPTDVNLTLQRLSGPLYFFSALIVIVIGMVLWYALFLWTIRPSHSFLPT